MHFTHQSPRSPLKVRVLIATAALALLSTDAAIAQQSATVSPWVLGASFGLTTNPPPQFADSWFYGPEDGPYPAGDICAPGRFVSFGVLGGRRLTSWLRTDLAAAANVEFNGCNITYVVEGFQYARIQYLGRLPGYAHFTLVARSVLESPGKPGFRPRLIAGIGCICEKRVPLGQLGAGFSAGSMHTRFALEAGGQVSHFNWARRITRGNSTAESDIIRVDSGSSTPAAFWLRVGVEYFPLANR